MLLLIPPPLHRLLYRAAHFARLRWWRLAKPQLEAVSIIAHDERGQLLLVRLSYGKGHWSFPGGGRKKDETPEQAAEREMSEEVGCKPHNLQLMGILEEDYFGARSRIHVFSAACMDTPRPDTREVIEARFFPTHSLPEPMSPMARRRLEMWRDHQKGGA